MRETCNSSQLLSTFLNGNSLVSSEKYKKLEHLFWTGIDLFLALSIHQETENIILPPGLPRTQKKMASFLAQQFQHGIKISLF